jgi:hypothetical protein
MTEPTIQNVIDRCECEVCLTVNQHRSYYQKADEYLLEIKERQSKDFEEQLAEPDVIAKMIELDMVVELQFYPRTPIGFYIVYHHDVQAAIREAVAILDKMAFLGAEA